MKLMPRCPCWYPVVKPREIASGRRAEQWLPETLDYSWILNLGKLMEYLFGIGWFKLLLSLPSWVESTPYVPFVVRSFKVIQAVHREGTDCKGSWGWEWLRYIDKVLSEPLAKILQEGGFAGVGVQ